MLTVLAAYHSSHDPTPWNGLASPLSSPDLEIPLEYLPGRKLVSWLILDPVKLEPVLTSSALLPLPICVCDGGARPAALTLTRIGLLSCEFCVHPPSPL